jgi:hypothetical protein
VNRDEAIAQCLAATSWRRADCAEVVDDRMVDGAYCEGSVYRDASGVRCISPTTLAQKRDALSRAAVEVAPPAPPRPLLVPLVLSLAFRGLCALEDAYGLR